MAELDAETLRELRRAKTAQKLQEQEIGRAHV